jgi:hypothetical protein
MAAAPCDPARAARERRAKTAGTPR